MRRAFTVNLAIILAANALVKPAYIFGVEVGLQNAVGTVAYGRLGYWLSVAILSASVLDLGMQNYTAVALAREPARIRELLPVALSLKLLAAPLYVGLVLGWAALAGVGAAELRLVGWVIVTQVALSTWQLLRNNLAAQARYSANSVVSVVDKAVLVVVVGGLLLAPAGRAWLTVARFAMLQAASVAIAIAVTVAATELGPGQRWLRWDARALRALLLASLPFAYTLLLNTLSSRVDILMLGGIRPDGDYQVGVYAASYRLLDAINMVAFLFATLLVPMLSAQVGRGVAVGALLRQGVRYMLALTLGAATFASFYGQAMSQALFGEATAAWGPVLTALLWSAVPTGLLYVVGSHLLALGRLRALNGIFAVAMVVNVGLNLAMIPRWGALGAAVATALTQGLIVVAEAVISWRAQGAAERGAGTWWLFVQALAFAAASAGVAYACAALGWGVAPALVVQGFACGVLAFATGLAADPRELLDLLRARRRAAQP